MHSDLKQILKAEFGYDEFRGEQQAIIANALEKKHSLVIMPTGMGKSLCYQLPAKIAGDGMVLVISPLIALMHDQVEKARQHGISASYLSATLHPNERETRYKKLGRGDYKLMFVTPERFRKQEFREAIQKQKITLLAIDEAHCISQWGHDFRPDYSRIKEFWEFLQKPTVMALTATATKAVKADILKQIGISDLPYQMFESGVERPNLALHIHDVYASASSTCHRFSTSLGFGL